MLILCCGPDSYRATQRAHELEAAFRSKHDPAGRSIEHLLGGKSAVDEVIERSLTVSLFSPMRFIRADGLIEHCSKTKTKALAHALSVDPDRVIVVSIEKEKPANADLKPFADVPKLLVSDYPLLSGQAFEAWVRQAGAVLGVNDEGSLRKLAHACNGDAWLASNELLKLAAGGRSEIIRDTESSLYQVADLFLRGHDTRYNGLLSDESEKLVYPLLQQVMTASHVRSVHEQGTSQRIQGVAAASILMMLVSRSGLSDAGEALALLP